MSTVSDPEEQRGIETLATALLASMWTTVYSAAINQVALALIEAGAKTGFRRGVGLLAAATGDGAAPVEPRAARSITVQELQQQVEYLSDQLRALLPLLPAPGDGGVVVHHRYGEVVR